MRAAIDNRGPTIEWVAVRLDSLVDAVAVTEYDLHPSPIRSPIFNTGKTSRINVAHFITHLMTDSDFWNTLNRKMPVICNKTLA